MKSAFLGRFGIAAALLLVVSLFRTAEAATLLVYNNNDSGPGSLRQVISDNNATAGGNTIIFSNIVTGTITLTNGQLVISKNLDLIGPGANVLAVSGNHTSRVFYVTNGTTVSISGLTISNGSAPGSSGPTNAGGGIFNDHSTLTVSNCMIGGNSAGGSGGGIYNAGDSGSSTLTVIVGTFSANSAIGNGGGIYNSGFGGMAMLTISNCTFSGNSGAANGGGIYNAGGALTVIASTFSGNTTAADATGCIYNFGGGTVQIGDTILNAGTAGTNIANFGPSSFTSLGYNISSDGGFGLLNGVGDQINTNPRLGLLQDNGGPTPTHAPLPGSPAIDQGKSFGLATDQRGRQRPYDNPAIPNASLGDGSDIGAVEAQSGEIFPSVVTNTNDSGPGSLRQALLAAVSGLTIEFQSNVLGTITLTSGELFVTNNINILGPGANVLAVNGNAASRVFHITNATVTVAGLTITNAHSTNSGGGILNEHSTLTMSNCTVAGNSTTVNGGGIYNNGTSNRISTLVLIGSTVNGNSATLNGGGIYNIGAFSGNAPLTVNASTISSNSAGGFGGGIYSIGINSGNATLTVIGSTLAGNSAASPGGGFYLDGALSGFAKLEIGNTILKAGASGANIATASGTVISDGYNLSSDNGAGFLTATGDQTNTEPMLGPLRDNGGPTPTMALLSDSPAIDTGKSFGLTTDQRGAPRPFDFSSVANASGGDGSDIGAFERGGNPTLNIQQVVNSAVVSWPWYYGDFTLQSSTNIALSNSWVSAGGSASVVSNQYEETNGPISGNLFFRLREN